MLQLAQKEILKFFQSDNKNVYKRNEIIKILSQNHETWNLASSISVKEFIDFLKQLNVLREYKMKFPHRVEKRFTRGEISEYELIQSLRPKSYFTHLTALSLHKLTPKIPKIIYLNCEQPPKYRPDNELIQGRIDFAFQNNCRTSKNIAMLNGKKICLLNGKFTGQVGVTSLQVDPRSEVRVSNIERTLIDCTVRPIYSGGVHNVLQVFKAAVSQVSVQQIIEMLSVLDYLYPYHQAIGFYMEYSGNYSTGQISLIDSIAKRFDFYLAHKMKKPKYSKRWRLYYPSNI